MTSPTDQAAASLRYFSERVRKGEKLDSCDAAVIEAAADQLVQQQVVITSAESRMSAAASILGSSR